MSRLSQVPYTDKRSVFGDHIDFWVDGGSISEAAELLTSSGSTGHFSVGVTSRSERRAQERTFDLTLRALGGGEDTLDAAAQLPADGHLDPDPARDRRDALGAPGDGRRAARPRRRRASTG